MRCEDVDAAVEELALGHAIEPQRSALLDHTSRCARCAAQLAEVLAVADLLLELAPEVGPPVGFEQRVTAISPQRRRQRRRPSPWLAVAAAAAVAVAYLPGVLRGDRPTTVDATVLAADGDPAGTIQLDGSELALVLHADGDWPGTWSCELRTDAGRWVEVGTWEATDVVDDTWSVEVDEDVADGATAMRVRSSRGDVLYTASLD